MKRDEAKKLADNALKDLQQALKAGRSEALERYLDVMSRFHKYSWNNCMLIAVQMPEATHVAGFRNWLKLGRHVRKGEKGIAIFAPLHFRKESDDPDEEAVNGISGFKVVHVFDVSQTEGEDLAEFAQISGDPGNLLRRLEDVVQTSDIGLSYEELPFGTKGVSRKGAIAIAEGLTEAERFAVLAHELAHEWLHDHDRRKEASTTVLETEAEAVAYVVCRSHGLDCSTRSSDYIQLYRGDAEVLAQSLEQIQKVAARMLDALASDPKDEEVAA